MDDDIELEPDFIESIKSGDKRKALVAIRDYIARELGTGLCPHCFRSGPKNGAEIASLTLRLGKVVEELDGIPDTEKVSSLDELTAKRRERLSGSPDPVDAGVASNRRRQGGRRTRGDGGPIS